MSTFNDYKSYKKYEPAYASWKQERDITNAKRLAYIKAHPEVRNTKDLQRGQTLLRAIDIMDEYSQKRAEDMEVATESVIGSGLEFSFMAGMGLGALIGKIKPIEKFFLKLAKNHKHAPLIALGIPAAIGALLGTLAAFPLMSWGAKAEVSASRKGRFEAMRKELKNPNGFAILTPEQIKEAQKRAKTISLDENKKKPYEFMKGLKTIKDMVVDSKEYKAQRKQFEEEIQNDSKHLDDEMSPEEILNAKKDQQLLTNLVEKIDIASQDYAENTELATQTAILTIGGLGGLFSLGLNKILNSMKIKASGKISAITNIGAVLAVLGMSIFSAQIQKQASRVGRYMVKKELAQNPDNFIYIDNNNLSEVKEFEVESVKKDGIFKFLKKAWKNNKEFNKYKKTTAKEEAKFYKAIETLELTPQQLKDAKRLQKNTFRTFNKVDENSQKYSESVEAFGQAASYPISLICTTIGAAVGLPFLMKKSNNKIQAAENFAKYLGAILISTFPSIGITAYITKQQKKASRVADMLAINELNDYRKFK